MGSFSISSFCLAKRAFLSILNLPIFLPLTDCKHSVAKLNEDKRFGIMFRVISSIISVDVLNESFSC
uniref:Putative secreted protein n=1 Tax=Anopheles darlingi TaxID=43151 RepID=A0A2M4D2D6_ANODA